MIISSDFAVFFGIVCGGASAQFGLGVQLPQSDFIWTWGSNRRSGAYDFSVVGSESSFRCDLQGKLRITASFGRTELRNLEAQLRSSMFFVQEAAYQMNVLENYGYLDWAILDCQRPVNEDTDEEIAEREAKALERAQRARERRRSRESD